MEPASQEKVDSGMRLMDALRPWPHMTWGSWLKGSEKLLPNFSSSIIKETSACENNITITIEDEGRTFFTAIEISNEERRRKVGEVLTTAKGKTLKQVGEMFLP